MKQCAKQAMWSARVSAFERSGLTRVAWCAREHVAVSTLDYWRRQWCEAPLERGQALVPIMVSETALTGRVDVAAGAIEIEIGSGIRMRAEAGVDVQWLGAFLRGLR